jgi:hypothetical protein
MGRIFALWAVVYFGQFLKYYRNSSHFRATFSKVKNMYLFWQKKVRATFWAIFSQTHLVTLNGTEKMRDSRSCCNYHQSVKKQDPDFFPLRS